MSLILPPDFGQTPKQKLVLPEGFNAAELYLSALSTTISTQRSSSTTLTSILVPNMKSVATSLLSWLNCWALIT